jgi:thiamine-phosphate pyrophosphorylase
MPAKERTAMTARIFCIVSDSHDHALLPALAAAGVDGFQVRAKHSSTRELVELTRAVIAAVPAHAQVIVNDRVDVALVAGADGVHLGSADLRVADARRIAPRVTIGATCRTRADVERAAQEGADYAGFGPMFATGSKDGLPGPLGPDALRAATGMLPLIAIGGVTAENAAAVRSAGAHGIAVIGAIWRPPDPVLAAKELVRAVS